MNRMPTNQNGAGQEESNDFINQFWLQGVVIASKRTGNAFEIMTFESGKTKLSCTVMLKNGEQATFLRVGMWGQSAEYASNMICANKLYRFKGYIGTRMDKATGFPQIELTASSIEQGVKGGVKAGAQQEQRPPQERPQQQAPRQQAPQPQRPPVQQQYRPTQPPAQRQPPIPEVSYEQAPSQNTKMNKNEIDTYAGAEDEDNIPF